MIDIDSKWREYNRFVIPGEPVTWKRPGIGRRRVRFDTQVDLKRAMGWHLRSVMRDKPPLNQPIAVLLKFYFKRLKKKVKYPINRRDLDNLSKLVLDAGNLITWHDDEIIVQLHASKEFSDTPRTEITVFVEKDSAKEGEDGWKTQIRSRKAGDGMPRSQIRKKTKTHKPRGR